MMQLPFKLNQSPARYRPRGTAEETDQRQRALLLSMNRKRPYCCCADSSNEFAPLHVRPQAQTVAFYRFKRTL
jgi:hypothetical protein